MKNKEEKMLLPLLLGAEVLGAKVLYDRSRKRDKKLIRARENEALIKAREQADRVKALYAAAGVETEEGSPLAQSNKYLTEVTRNYDLVRLERRLKRQEANDQMIAEVSIGLAKMLAGSF